jgi:hypothetical protein
MQGLGLFACRKAAWPGFNRKFRGFGGEEGYIHEKFRRQGGRVLCLPFLRWAHRFDRPSGTRYENRWEDRIRNYLIGWHELGMDSQATLEHFCGFIGRTPVARTNVAYLNERNSPLWRFDAIYCLADRQENFDDYQMDIDKMGITRVMQKLLLTDPDQEIAVQLSSALERIFQLATISRLREIIILNGPLKFAGNARQYLVESLEQLDNMDWDIADLGKLLIGEAQSSELGSAVILNKNAIDYFFHNTQQQVRLLESNGKREFPDLQQVRL